MSCELRLMYICHALNAVNPEMEWRCGGTQDVSGLTVLEYCT